MSTKMRPYVVRQGDHLNKIAFKHNFNPEHVWSHEENQALRLKRPNSNQLYPGDVIYIPNEPEEPNQVVARSLNKFTAKVPTVRVKVCFLQDGIPLANEECDVSGIPGTSKEDPGGLRTDAEGLLAFEVSALTREIEVYFPSKNTVYELAVGDMDPLSEPMGLEKRLQKLGYLVVPDPTQPEEANSNDDLNEAVVAFQNAKGLPISGSADSQTLDELAKTHGT